MLRQKVTIRATLGKKISKDAVSNPLKQPFREMMIRMAEAQRELIWIQTAFFMGWGCDACIWRDFIPRDPPTLIAPSTETRQAFKQHKCEGRHATTAPNLIHMASHLR
jgi:hypothetical protein